MKFVDIVFDGPPSHKSGRFVEVEDMEERSISYGTWIDRGNGLWALRIPAPDVMPHVHVAGTTVGKDIDECAVCGQNLRCDIHSAEARGDHRFISERQKP